MGDEGEELCSSFEIQQINTPTYSRNTNRQALGEVIYDSRDNFMIELAVNNGISAYSFERIVSDPAGDPEPELNLTSLDFGEVIVFEAEDLPVMLNNANGRATLEITSVSFASGDETVFSTDLAAASTILAGDSIEFTMSFTPEAAIEYVDTLRIVTNAGTLEIVLMGEGYEYWPLVWRIPSDTSWFGIEHQVRTIAYSASSGHLYTVSRRGGQWLKAIDPATGEVVKDLNTDGTIVTGGTYNVNMCAATSDGQIFLGNLALANGAYKLYKYADEDAVPVKVFDAAFADRVGDCLGVSGTGNDVNIYLTGSGTSKIFVLTTIDGAVFTVTDTIPLPDVSAAQFSVSPVGDDAEYLFIQGANKIVRYIGRDGTVYDEWDFLADSLPNKGNSVHYFEVPQSGGAVRRFFASFGSPGFFPGTRVVELFGEPGAQAWDSSHVYVTTTPVFSQNSNANGTGQCVYVPGLNYLVEVSTNNGISAYDFSNIAEDAGLALNRNNSFDAQTLNKDFTLEQNYPNPFNPTTDIRFTLPEAGFVRLSVFNMLGQEVAVLQNAQMSAGVHTIKFDGATLGNGIYFYRLNANGNQMTKKMMLMK